MVFFLVDRRGLGRCLDFSLHRYTDTKCSMPTKLKLGDTNRLIEYLQLLGREGGGKRILALFQREMRLVLLVALCTVAAE